MAASCAQGRLLPRAHRLLQRCAASACSDSLATSASQSGTMRTQTQTRILLSVLLVRVRSPQGTWRAEQEEEQFALAAIYRDSYREDEDSHGFSLMVVPHPGQAEENYCSVELSVRCVWVCVCVCVCVPDSERRACARTCSTQAVALHHDTYMPEWCVYACGCVSAAQVSSRVPQSACNRSCSAAHRSDHLSCQGAGGAATQTRSRLRTQRSGAAHAETIFSHVSVSLDQRGVYVCLCAHVSLHVCVFVCICADVCI